MPRETSDDMSRVCVGHIAHTHTSNQFPATSNSKVQPTIQRKAKSLVFDKMLSGKPISQAVDKSLVIKSLDTNDAGEITNTITGIISAAAGVVGSIVSVFGYRLQNKAIKELREAQKNVESVDRNRRAIHPEDDSDEGSDRGTDDNTGLDPKPQERTLTAGDNERHGISPGELVEESDRPPTAVQDDSEESDLPSGAMQGNSEESERLSKTAQDNTGRDFGIVERAIWADQDAPQLSESQHRGTKKNFTERDSKTFPMPQNTRLSSLPTRLSADYFPPCPVGGIGSETSRAWIFCETRSTIAPTSQNIISRSPATIAQLLPPCPTDDLVL
jgi:hypothetical protein